MYRNEKKILTDICETLHEIHGALTGVSAEERAELCDAAQQGAIRVGESLEKEDAEVYADTVHRLEEYCETIYRLSSGETLSEETLSGLNDIADAVADVISGIKCRIKVVFFPYKAEMWDSLESFYLAAREDPDCDAFLVPIPYYEFDKNGGAPKVNYDIERFPKDENPIPFNKVDHTDGSIDIAYIHNPYDDHNLVTSVHPAYYSRELKKYVNKLVYTPYFVTAGFVSDDQLSLPVYDNADFVVLQSEYAKRSCKGVNYYDKILPFGSSKIDMIIKKCEKGVDMPEEWKDIIGGRRTLMLNTSINDLLNSNEATLSKLEYFFDLISKDDRLAVIWRPHPLLESTFKSMRPEMLERYERIKNKFIDEKIGVFDTTPDISDTVAIADGYIGSGASSVINLFGAAGKPAFLFNNTLRDPVSQDDRRVIQGGIEYCRGRLYIHPGNINAIFSLPVDDIHSPLKYEGSIPDTPDWTNALPGPVEVGGKLYFAPFFADDAVRYDPVMKTVETLGSVGRQYDVRFNGIDTQWPKRKTLFFLPANTKYLIMEYLPDKDEWLYHQDCIADLHKGLEKPSFIGMITGGTSWEQKIYYSTAVCNRIMMLEQGNGNYKIIHLGRPELSYELPLTLKGASKEGLWLGMMGSSDIRLAPWDSLEDEKGWRVYKMPDDYEFAHDSYGDVIGAHGGFVDYGDYMIIFPFRSPHMLKLNKKTGEIRYIFEDIFKDTDKNGLGYELKRSSVICASCIVGGLDRWVIQRTRDLHMFLIDFRDESYEEFVPEISEDIFDKIVPKDAGFFKGDVFDYFRMSESRLFPLENFLNNFADNGYEGVKVQQREALSTLASNLDGTCGIKTHEYIKNVILNEG